MEKIFPQLKRMCVKIDRRTKCWEGNMKIKTWYVFFSVFKYSLNNSNLGKPSEKKLLPKVALTPPPLIWDVL